MFEAVLFGGFAPLSGFGLNHGLCFVLAYPFSAIPTDLLEIVLDRAFLPVSCLGWSATGTCRTATFKKH